MNNADHIIYLDNAASMPVRPEVIRCHAQLCAIHYANPHASNRLSEISRRACEQAAVRLAEFVGAEPTRTQVVWTSGGTEANNLAIFGSVRGGKPAGGLVVEASAHNSLRAPGLQLDREGYACLDAPVRHDGCLDLDRLAALPVENASMLALCHVNNETGAIQDLVAVRDWMRQRMPNARLLVDASQSFGKLSIPWHAAQIDLLSIGGHKIGGPAGVGALLMRSGLELRPLIVGGDQQHGLRAGTLDVVAILEFLEAAELACRHREREFKRIHALRQRCAQGIASLPNSSAICISPETASPYILSIALPEYQGAIVMRMLAERGVVVATGSACAAEGGKLSHVLTTMGFSQKIARGALRISFGPDSTAVDVDRAVAVLGEVLNEY